MGGERLPVVDIIIVNYKKHEDTLECIRSLRKVSYPVRKIYIVDNTEDGENVLEKSLGNEPGVQYIKSGGNLGFAGGNNLGIKESLKNNPDYILLLNNDTVVKEDFLRNLIEVAVKERADLATGKIYYYFKPDIIWGAGGRIDWKRGMGCLYGINQRDNEDFNFVKEVSFISGCMILIKKDVFEKIGFLPEDYFMYHEDVDFSLTAVNKGLKLIYVPTSIIWHKTGAARVDETPFQFYYFVRNSAFIIRKFADFRQKTCYLLYSPVYFFLKCCLVQRENIKFIHAFLAGIKDALLNKRREV